MRYDAYTGKLNVSYRLCEGAAVVYPYRVVIRNKGGRVVFFYFFYFRITDMPETGGKGGFTAQNVASS